MSKDCVSKMEETEKEEQYVCAEYQRENEGNKCVTQKEKVCVCVWVRMHARVTPPLLKPAAAALP